MRVYRLVRVVCYLSGFVFVIIAASLFSDVILYLYRYDYTKLKNCVTSKKKNHIHFEYNRKIKMFECSQNDIFSKRNR